MMAKVLGVTGLIGAGKSCVIRSLQVLYGIECFDCDKIAKGTYYFPQIRKQIMTKLGIDPIGQNGVLEKGAIAGLLADMHTKETLEGIIHKAVEAEFIKWRNTLKYEWVALESAILFTSGMHTHCDLILSVVANKEIRKKRVLSRDPLRVPQDFELLESLQSDEATRQNNEADIFINNDGDTSIIRELEIVYYQQLDSLTNNQ